jgi:hypothetical protein
MPACHHQSKEPSVTTPIGHIQQQLPAPFRLGRWRRGSEQAAIQPPSSAVHMVEVAANRKEGIEGKRVRRYEET